ncbi:MAG TPA: IS110 family transposase [Chitinivibrionales bacterium]|nr:IS110 family transposase [Chitinivibrionales bacterium]
MDKKMQDWIVKGKEVFVGLDDAKKTWRVCVRSEKMAVHESSMPANYDVLRAYLRRRYPECTIKVMYEAGFRGFNLYDRLSEDGIECVVLPPHLMLEEKVNRVKTDRRDAWRLAKMLEGEEHLRGCHVPDKERREDRQACRTLNAVEKEIKSTRNRIRKLLQYHGIETAIPEEKAWGKSEFRSVEELSVGVVLRKPIKVLLSLLENLWTYQIELRKELLALSKNPRYQRAFAIARGLPGIGWLTAIRLVLELGEDFTRFSTGKSLANFLGLTGGEHSSGETEHKGRITGQGPTFVRSWMIESAWVSIRKDPVLREKFEKVRRNSGSKKKAIVAVARKLAVRLYACMVMNQEYQIGLVA